MGDNQYARIHAKDMSKFLGRHVCIVGELLNMVDDVALVKTSDNHEIQVELPPGERFETRYCQLIGKVITSSRLNVTQIIPGSQDFNIENYNKAVDLASGKFSYLFQ